MRWYNPLFSLSLNQTQTVDEAIEKYKTLSKTVFTSKSKDPTATYDHQVLETQIKEVITKSRVGLPEDAFMEDDRPNSCRTFVVSTWQRATGAVRMTSYYTATSDPFPARIWEAARATSAAPTFFSPIVIEDVRYGDGGTGWNNPTKEAIGEALNIWPNRPIGCLVSIGTGMEEPLQLKDTAEKLPQYITAVLKMTSPKLAHGAAVAEYCIQCLTSCELVHRELSEHPEKVALNSNYFRLNVPNGMSKIGLDEWDKLGDMIALTRSYMSGEMLHTKQIIAKLLLHPESAS